MRVLTAAHFRLPSAQVLDPSLITGRPEADRERRALAFYPLHLPQPDDLSLDLRAAKAPTHHLQRLRHANPGWKLLVVQVSHQAPDLDPGLW